MDILIECQYCSNDLTLNESSYRGTYTYQQVCGKCRNVNAYSREFLEWCESEHSAQIRDTGSIYAITQYSIYNSYTNDYSVQVRSVNSEGAGPWTSSRRNVDGSFQQEMMRQMDDHRRALEREFSIYTPSLSEIHRVELTRPLRKKHKPNIPEHMKQEYAHIPKDIRTEMESRLLHISNTISNAVPEEYKEEIMIAISKEFTTRVIDYAKMKKASCFIFTEQEWIRIITKVFYAGYDYANVLKNSNEN